MPEKWLFGSQEGNGRDKTDPTANGDTGEYNMP